MLIYFLFCVYISSSQILALNEFLIQLPNGKIQGYELRTPNGVPFKAFQGIPYAKPPVGKLRFQPPEPPENWKGIKLTISDTRACIQYSGLIPDQSEDCLYLNVYVPKVKNQTNLPVLFYIHGGSFRTGSGSRLFGGPDYFIEDGGVIFVTLNYRLTVFGFLATEDMVSPGNNGLKDAIMALKWVYKNIHLFGGDPNKITLFGESAGSVAVSYLLLSKPVKGLFRGAIQQSGTAINMYNFQRYPKEIAYRIAHYIDSKYTKTKSTREVFDLISRSSVHDLLNATRLVTAEFPEDTFKNINYGHIFGGVIEPEHKDAVITKKMYEMYVNNETSKVPQIIGMTSEESVGVSANMSGFKEVLKIYDANYSVLVPGPLNVNASVDKLALGTLIKEIYVGNGTLAENPVAGIRFVSDIWINRAVVKAAKLTSRNADVYCYIFSYMGRLGLTNYSVEGVGHAQDLLYLLKIVGVNLNLFPKADVATLRRMVKMWNNFAKTLNPTPQNDALLNNTIWPKATFQQNNQFFYMDVGPELKIKANPKSDTLDKWDGLIKNYGNGPYDTY